MEQRIALLSAYEKNGIEHFAQELKERGWSIWGSAGTAKFLNEQGVETVDISTLVGEPILGHRVVTLNEKIHAGLLATDSLSDKLDLSNVGASRIDLLYVDLYPLEKEIAKPGATEESIIEMTDIGGVALLRSAAKGRRIVVSRKADLEAITIWLKDGEPQKEEMLRSLAVKAEYVAAKYCFTSAGAHARGVVQPIFGGRSVALPYGENPYQNGEVRYYKNSGPLGLDKFTLLAGKPLSFTNITDASRLLYILSHIAAVWDVNFCRPCRNEIPYMGAIVKHGNACASGVWRGTRDVLESLMRGDPLAVFGGFVMVNFSIGKDEAEILKSNPNVKFDGICAFSFSAEAVEMLKRKGDRCRLLQNENLSLLSARCMNTSPIVRSIWGGDLLQSNYTFVPDLKDPVIQRVGEISRAEEQDLMLAWAIGSMSNSNTITIVKNKELLGNGVGQQARVYAASLAVERARTAGHGEELPGSSAYSDSFFVHPDALEVLAEAGVKAVFTTSGSIADERIIARAKELGVSLLLIPDKIGRGFFGHT